MKEFIVSWLTGFAILAALAALLDGILPDSSIKKYARYALSLMVAIMLLSPVVNLISGGIRAEINLKDAITPQYDSVDLSQYKDYLYEVYNRNQDNKNE